MSNIDVDSINDLAQHIRQVNGNNDMGSAKLAESILEWQATRAQPAQDGEWVRCDERQTDAINHALDVLSKHGDAFTSVGAMQVLEEMLEPQPPKSKEDRGHE